MEKRELPIGVFDSGVGGVSVLREMVRLLPHEDFLFFGDSINAPYGTKTRDQVTELTLANVAHLREEGIKAVVIACNTATSAAITALRETYTDMPVIGIEPAVKPAVMMGEHPHVIVMATPMTAKGDKFLKMEARYEEQADITALPCPGLMEFVEQGITEGPELDAYLRGLLAPYMDEKPDAIVLGCTHYPFVRGALREIVGEDVSIIDGSEGTARELQRRLSQEDLLADRTREGAIRFEMSIPEKADLAQMLLNKKDV